MYVWCWIYSASQTSASIPLEILLKPKIDKSAAFISYLNRDLTWKSSSIALLRRREELGMWVGRFYKLYLYHNPHEKTYAAE